MMAELSLACNIEEADNKIINGNKKNIFLVVTGNSYFI